MPELDARPMLTMADMGHGGMGHDMGRMGPRSRGYTGKPASDARRTRVTVHQQNRPRLILMQGIRCHRKRVLRRHQTRTRGTRCRRNSRPIHTRVTTWRPWCGPQQHPSTEDGNPLVDMQTMVPTSRLDDPGIGLRDNGRRVLTYADLKSVFETPTAANRDGRLNCI